MVQKGRCSELSKQVTGGPEREMFCVVKTGNRWSRKDDVAGVTVMCWTDRSLLFPSKQKKAAFPQWHGKVTIFLDHPDIFPPSKLHANMTSSQTFPF